MAANYWESTQRRYWQFSKQELAQLRQKLEVEEQNLVQAVAIRLQIKMLIGTSETEINKLGKRFQVRQQAMATAQLYVRRFYSKVEIRKTNPYLVIATALYLACKMEESPQYIRQVVTDARSLWPDLFSTDTSKLGECEFFLISEMNSQLIVHHPYRTLLALQGTFSLSQEESSLAWTIINDHYMTDLPLLYPPHIIAITSILLALVVQPITNGGLSTTGAGANSMATAAQAALNSANQAKNASSADKVVRPALTKVQKLSNWLAETNVDIEGMVDCTQEIISFYDAQEQYNEKTTREQINKFVKARGLDR